MGNFSVFIRWSEYPTLAGQDLTTDSVYLPTQCHKLAVSFIVGGTSSSSIHVGVLAGRISSHVEDWIVDVTISDIHHRESFQDPLSFSKDIHSFRIDIPNHPLPELLVNPRPGFLLSLGPVPVRVTWFHGTVVVNF
jgi:hypothetical protein